MSVFWKEAQLRLQDVDQSSVPQSDRETLERKIWGLEWVGGAFCSDTDWAEAMLSRRDNVYDIGLGSQGVRVLRRRHTRNSSPR